MLCADPFDSCDEACGVPVCEGDERWTGSNAGGGNSNGDVVCEDNSKAFGALIGCSFQLAFSNPECAMQGKDDLSSESCDCLQVTRECLQGQNCTLEFKGK